LGFEETRTNIPLKNRSISMKVILITDILVLSSICVFLLKTTPDIGLDRNFLTDN